MKAVSIICLVSALLFGNSYSVHDEPADALCGMRNTSLQQGEEVNFTVYYSVAGVYMHAGDAVFSNKLEKLNGRPVFHVVGQGSSLSSYDWVYKVRDRYESYIDTLTMQPLKFVRDVLEGSTRKYENISFNPSSGTVVSDSGVFKVPGCIQDVMSAIYTARNIDFSKYHKGEKIPFNMFLENEVHHLYIRYMGKEVVKTRYGKFKAIKFKPLVVAGTIFSGGEKMTVWVTDDQNHLPVRLEGSILIGSVKVDMTGYKNLRYPMLAMEKQKSK